MSSTDESDDEFINVNTVEMAELMTCQICHELYDDATTITECLHTFCRQCIYRKLSEAGARRCPECNTYLGSAPLDRLKQNRPLNSIMDMFFPKEDGVSGNSSSATMNTQVASSSTVPLEGVATPSRLNKETVKTNGSHYTETDASALGDSSFSSEGAMNEDEDSVEEFSNRPTSPETSNRPRDQ